MIKKKLTLLPAILMLVTNLAFADRDLFAELELPFGASTEVLEAPDAETAWKPIPDMATMEGMMIAMNASGETTQEGRMRAIVQHYLEVGRRATTFMKTYPEHPQRWRALQIISNYPNEFANEDGTVKRVGLGFTWDIEKFQVFRKQLEELNQAAMKASDVPSEVRLVVESRQPGGLIALMSQAQEAAQKGEAVDFSAFSDELMRLSRKYPDADMLRRYVNNYAQIHTMAKSAKEDMVADLEVFGTSPNEHVRAAAQVELDKLTAFDKAFDLTFTAVDGTEVDIADYRGKVVLIDFWATWCGPCIAELPNIKQVYSEYKDKGFEIIGIALENARLVPSDTEEQTAAKLERAKKVLNAFTEKLEMPWPQYFDGKHWNNDIAQRFGIAGIPAMFLIDQEGRIATTEARGHQLEAEVRRLLGLEAKQTESKEEEG